MTHFMIDIETLGTTPRAVIAQIAIAAFNPYTFKIISTFGTNVDVKSHQDIGGEITADTVLFWLQQDKEVSKNVFSEGVKISTALHNLELYLDRTEPIVGNRIMWANSPSFDLTIIKEAMHMEGMIKDLWKFWNERDFRTIKSLAPHVTSAITNAPKHLASSDVRHQIDVLQGIIKELGLKVD